MNRDDLSLRKFLFVRSVGYDADNTLHWSDHRKGSATLNTSPPARIRIETKMSSGILVFDPNAGTLVVFERELKSLGYVTFATSDPEEAREFLKSDHPTIIFCDVAALSSGTSQHMRWLSERDLRSSLIVLASLAEIDAAVEAVRAGAAFYLLRPFALENLKLAVERAVAQASGALLAQSSEPTPQGAGEIIVGVSDAIQRILELAGRVARSDANIIIFGESGTGKELFAKAIHTCSNRSGGVFVPVDCASLPENLLEAELFGYEKGAFTGAVHTKPGVMELANRGTLFFDEIAELPMSLQPKLLRALQERQHRRLGGTRIVDFDVRVVAATNRNLRGLVAERQFRQDLFYRLNVVPLILPPLRARAKDVILLANHFLKDCARKNGSLPKRFAPEVIGLFETYSWPGNVRELQNVVEYSCAVTRGETITVQDIPEEFHSTTLQLEEVVPDSPELAFKEAKGRFESAYVAGLLKRCDYNVSRAAKAAGVDRKTFYGLLKKYHLASRSRSASS